MSISDEQQRRLDAMPQSMRGTYRKAVGADGRPSKANAIHAQCDECTGYDRQAVKTCTSRGCPLWPVRPYQTRT